MASATAPKKVGVESPAPEKKERKKKDKVKKQPFEVSKAVDSNGASIPLDDDGRMTALPANWTKEFSKLGRASFANKSLFLEWKLFLFDQEVAKRRELFVAKLKESAEGLTPVEQKKRKAMRMAKQYQALLAELKEQGITLDV